MDSIQQGSRYCRKKQQDKIDGSRKEQERDYHTWVLYSGAADIVGRSTKTNTWSEKEAGDYHTWILYNRAADIVGRSNKKKNI